MCKPDATEDRASGQEAETIELALYNLERIIIVDDGERAVVIVGGDDHVSGVDGDNHGGDRDASGEAESG